MNLLPNEIENIIWRHYWQFEYKNVINEITQPIKIEKESINFYSKFIGVLSNEYKTNYKHYFSVINDDIKYIVENKGLMIIARKNQLLLRFITNHYITSIFSGVDEKYKHVSALYVLLSGSNRFHILHMFQNINKLMK